jgi:hypothetical protein
MNADQLACVSVIRMGTSRETALGGGGFRSIDVRL